MSCYPSVVGALWPTVVGILPRTFIRDCWKHRTAWAESCRLCDLQQQKFKFKQLRSLRPRLLLMSFQTKSGKVKIPFAEALFLPKVCTPHWALGFNIRISGARKGSGTHTGHMTLDGTRKNWIIKGGQLRENWAQSLKLSLGWWHRSIASCPWEANAKGSRFPSGLGYSVSSRLAVGEDKERVLNWPGTSHGFE